ncbi:MAG: sucrase ferredoxin [Nocardioides sp.]
MTQDFRCAAASVADGESMAGTAPTQRHWLLVEYAGAWPSRAVADSRLPAPVRDFLAGVSGSRVQLIRRHRDTGPGTGPETGSESGAAGTRLFRLRLGQEPVVYTTCLRHIGELPNLDPAWSAVTSPTSPWRLHEEPVFLVCTNGSRDRCCAELGRPIAARLAERWPGATWETTHLGGHRFAGTLLALPSAITLGRLETQTAISVCGDVLAGGHPWSHSRGRAGQPVPAQVGELYLRRLLNLTAQADVCFLGADGDQLHFHTAIGPQLLRVESSASTPRRLSCTDGSATSVPEFRVVRL